MGTAAIGIGDFNGDSVDDVAIGAPISTFGGGTSAAYIVLGRSQFPQTFDLSSSGGIIKFATETLTFGTDTVPTGDIDGDGLSDIYIHQVFKTQSQPPLDPHLYLVYGMKLPGEITIEFNIEEIGVSFRGAVLTGDSLPTRTLRNPIVALPDFNGDNLPDLAIGQPIAEGPLGEIGMVTILFGSPSLDGAHEVRSLVEQGKGVEILGSIFSDKLSAEGFGGSVASAGDVNGDGLSDLVVADPKWINAQLGVPVGRVYLIFGSRTFPPLLRIDDLKDRGITLENTGQTPILRIADVFGGGDLDGDGLSDYGFSLQEKVGFAGNAGRLFVLRGRRDSPPRITFASIEDETFGFKLQPPDPAPELQRGFGTRVVMVPDENSDGRDELFVGVSRNGGEAIVLDGGIPILPTAIERPFHRFKAVQAVGTGSQVGMILNSAGDVNGDAIPDYVIGSPDLFGDPNDFTQSRVYLVFGGFETQLLTVRDVSPKQAPIGESIAVEISGTGFVDGTQVLFGSQQAPGVKVLDPHTLLVSTPVVQSQRTVDVVLVRPDSKRVMLPSAFTFFDDRRELSLPEIDGVITFIGSPQRIQPRVISDVNGDRLRDYALRSYATGAAHLVYGGTNWSGVIDEGALAHQSVNFHNNSFNPPDLFPLTDIDHDGKDEYILAQSLGDYDFRGEGRFAVMFKSYSPDQQLSLDDINADSGAAFYSSSVPMGFDVRDVSDFNGDGNEDLVTYSVKFGTFTDNPQIVLVFGPLQRGEHLDLDNSTKERVVRIQDIRSPEFFGQGLSPIGDFNGDGLGDLAYQDVGQSVIFIVLGHQPSSSLLELGDLEANGLVLKIPFGRGILRDTLFKRAGDINGDGLDDLLLYGQTSLDRGRGYLGVLLGRKELAREITWESEISGHGGFFLHGTEPFETFGTDAVVADVDQDGLAGVICGSTRLTEFTSRPKPGLVRIVHNVSQLRGEFVISDVNRPLTAIEGSQLMDRFGQTVAVLGDQDADGLPEVLVEAVPASYLIPGKSLFGPFKEQPFVRGDTDSDKKLSLTDGIRILNVLFLGSPWFSCEDSADSNDDGVINLSDAVFLFSYLFLGGRQPPPPFPNEGLDPTEDLLTCLPSERR